MKGEKKGTTFEAAMTRLEEILRLLEDGGAPLDQTMSLYEEGAKLAALCAKKLGEAEQVVEQLDASLRAVNAPAETDGGKGPEEDA